MTFEQIVAGAPVLTDGAWGTELQKLGLEPGAFADGWNLTEPERVLSVARAYVEAGSRVILTNTFRSNPVSLAGHGLAGQAGAINREGVRISRAAAGSRAAVFASVGPTGKLLVAGDITEEELRSAFEAQVEALAEGEPDALLLETFADLAEARIALGAAKRTGLPVLASFVFDSGKNGDRTMMGVRPEQAAAEMEAAGASAVGANCGRGIADYIGICARIRTATSLPVWMKPNAGLPRIVEGQAQYGTSAGEFAAHIPELVRAGATFVGGCCGSDPSFIRATAEALR